MTLHGGPEKRGRLYLTVTSTSLIFSRST